MGERACTRSARIPWLPDEVPSRRDGGLDLAKGNRRRGKGALVGDRHVEMGLRTELQALEAEIAAATAALAESLRSSR